MDLMTMQPKANEVSELLKTMAHPERLLVLCQLMKRGDWRGQIARGLIIESICIFTAFNSAQKARSSQCEKRVTASILFSG